MAKKMEGVKVLKVRKNATLREIYKAALGAVHGGRLGEILPR